MGKVVENQPKIQQKSEWQKFKEGFIADIPGIKGKIVDELLIPAVKNFVYNGVDAVGKAFTQSMYYLIFGTKPQNTNYYGGSPNFWSQPTIAPSINYNQINQQPPRLATSFQFNNIEYQTEQDATNVLVQMIETIARMKVVSLFDWYDYSNMVAPQSYTAYGWTDLSNVKVVPSNGGYILTLPKVIPIK